MSVQVFMVRLFAGRNLGVSYDDVAGTISILGQSLTLSTMSASLLAQWNAAIGGAASTYSAPTDSKPAFGGDNIGQAVGAVLDLNPTWRSAVTAALASYTATQTQSGLAPDVESWSR